MKRRSLLAAILAAGISPAIARAASLMPIKPAVIWTPWHQSMSSLSDTDFTMEGFFKQPRVSELRITSLIRPVQTFLQGQGSVGEWTHIAVTSCANPEFYVNSALVLGGPRNKNEADATEYLTSVLRNNVLCG